MKTKKNKIPKNKTKKNEPHKKQHQCILKKINNYDVLFINNKSETTSVQSYIFKGFLHENKHNLGINHLLEHVLSNAYKKCKNYNCYEYLHLLGFLSNASTNYNIINYYVTGLNKTIEKMLDYIINITVNPVFDNKLVTKEKQAVHNELLISMDKPHQKLQNEMNKHFYDITGLKYMDDDQMMIDNLKHFNYKTLMKYYRDNYNNGNTLFVVSGDFDNLMVSDILKYKLPKNPVIKDKVNFKDINCFKNTSGIYHYKNPSLQSTQIMFFFPTKFYTNSDKLIKLSLTALILQAILFEKLRTEKKLVYNIKIRPLTYCCGTVLKIFVNTKNENVKDVLDNSVKIFKEYKKKKVDDKYIKAEKKRYLIKFHDRTNTSTNYADLYGLQYIYNRFLGSKIMSPLEIKNSIIKVSANDIRTTINDVFDFNKLMIVYSNNKKKQNLKI